MSKFMTAALVCGLWHSLQCRATALEIRPILTLEVARKIPEACIARPIRKGGRCTSR